MGTDKFAYTVANPKGNRDTAFVNISIKGGPYQNLSISPEPYDFGDIAVGSSKSQIFTISNIGTSLLEIEKLWTETEDADFTIVNDTCSEQKLGYPEVCTFEVIFSPVSKGPKRANISILSDEPNSSLAEMAVSGNGFTIFTVKTPVFSPQPGNYTETQSVSISCLTPDAIIYYTIDGTKPTFASRIYHSPIEITETTTIRARAYKNWALSRTAIGEYLIMQIEKGDINGDGNVDLADAIIVLKVLSDIDTGNSVIRIRADINGDEQIGIEELIYILRQSLSVTN